MNNRYVFFYGKIHQVKYLIKKIFKLLFLSLPFKTRCFFILVSIKILKVLLFIYLREALENNFLFFKQKFNLHFYPRYPRNSKIKFFKLKKKVDVNRDKITES